MGKLEVSSQHLSHRTTPAALAKAVKPLPTLWNAKPILLSVADNIWAPTTIFLMKELPTGNKCTKKKGLKLKKAATLDAQKTFAEANHPVHLFNTVWRNDAPFNNLRETSSSLDSGTGGAKRPGLFQSTWTEIVTHAMLSAFAFQRAFAAHGFHLKHTWSELLWGSPLASLYQHRNICSICSCWSDRDGKTQHRKPSTSRDPALQEAENALVPKHVTNDACSTPLILTLPASFVAQTITWTEHW